ncbi:uncharacterized protein LOC116213013 [Punica granatum]|uniref:Uncharacterized protein LOC116213013 n=2 Tax=Punica granatum TaxID=22663 RepID=A0A6P8E1C3_PUNGR|nr:uncharacterized protein LOC116213013 [Punica granatum]
MYADRAISNPIGGCDALSTTKPKLLASPDPTWQYESLSGSCRKEVGEDEALQLQLRGASMAVAAPSPAAFLPRTADKPRSFPFSFSSAPRYNHGRLLPARKPLTIVAMAPRKKVNKLDDNWEKQWFGAGIFYEGSEQVEVDVFKKLEKRKVLSNVEKAGLLSKAEELGFTLSSIEKLGVFSKAEELGLLSLLEKVAGTSPSTLASAALPILVVAVAAVVLIPDDSTGLVVVQALVAGALTVGAAGLLIGSVVLGGLQEAD